MPDIIETLKEKYATNQAECLNMLPELFKQYDEGLIKVLPCKVGDTVFINHDYWGNLCKGFIYEIADTTHWHYCISSKSSLVGKEFLTTVNLSDFGKTIFLTREAAEKALESET